jgi:thiamine pyrophosphokinase
MQKDVSVTVTPGVGITIDPTTPIQLKKNQDSVQWKATTKDQQFTIVLPDGEPAVTCSMQGSKWVCVAGPFTTGTTMKNVKYDITAPNAPTLDPDIEVFP